VRHSTMRYDAPVLKRATVDYHGFRFMSTTYDAAGHHEIDWHIPELTVVMRLSGETYFAGRSGGRTEHYAFRPAQLLFLPLDHSLRGYTKSVGTARNGHLLVKPDWVARASDGELDLSRLKLRWSADVRNPLIVQAMLGLVREVEQPGPMGRIYAESLALGIVTELVRYHAALPGALSRADGVKPHRFQRVTEFIDANLGQDLSLATLAAEACLSRVHFVRQFKRLTGLSPHQYVLRRRVERAATLLKNRDTCLKALALDVGFSSQSHLTEAFRRVYGTTPGAYRDQHAPVATQTPLRSFCNTQRSVSVRQMCAADEMVGASGDPHGYANGVCAQRGCYE